MRIAGLAFLPAALLVAATSVARDGSPPREQKIDGEAGHAQQRESVASRVAGEEAPTGPEA